LRAEEEQAARKKELAEQKQRQRDAELQALNRKRERDAAAQREAELKILRDTIIDRISTNISTKKRTLIAVESLYNECVSPGKERQVLSIDEVPGIVQGLSIDGAMAVPLSIDGKPYFALLHTDRELRELADMVISRGRISVEEFRVLLSNYIVNNK
jgi:hypothetical protein